ncbi:secreted antigen 1 [Babesia caballi]|uniref:Secreted antigen 1 n=1 Tax=Babesia caballi TaxID=5871 RepID=A0AAV4LS01_BABCB|nr:secreted antigen 1 [Babesia caballi]
MTGCATVPAPKTFKEALEFAGALSVNHGLKQSVGQELQERVATALGPLSAPQSVADGDSISQNFNDVLTKLNDLRNSIVDDSHLGSYGTYETLKQSSHDASCVDRCITQILGVLPRLYATLAYLAFKVDTNNGTLGGGNWSRDQCNASSGYGTGTLGAWLKYANTVPNGAPSAQNSDAKLLPGGFGRANLKSTEGSALKSKLESLVNDSGADTAGCLHNLVLDVCIITDFSTCNIAVYLIVLTALSDKQENKFQDQPKTYTGLDGALKTLHDKIKSFAPEQSGGEEALLKALFKGSPVAYSKRLSDTLRKYLEWLTTIIPSLIASLNLLKTDAAKWDQDGLEYAQTSGPFAYGFSFGGKWSSNWSDQIRSEIPGAITKLTTDLTKLHQILKQHFNGSGSSAGSIAGSLLGTAAVGGAGAAVEFNVGGVTTALKGAIGLLK